MKSFSISLLVVLLGLGAIAQSSGTGAKPGARATIEGIVIKDPGSEPVKKAVIELIADDQQQGGNYTAVSGLDGSFRIEGVATGRYHLFAERTGYVESAEHGGRSTGRILSLAAGQELKDIQIRFAAAAVVSGRVTDEDGDPLQNAEVSVLRRSFAPGRSHWQQVGSERTNDLGEYRIAGLAAGSYYVSVNPPPDFKSLLDSADSAQGKPVSVEKPSTSYQTTFYPGTLDRSQASPIQLHAEDDFLADFSLAPAPTLSIRGAVTNLPPRSSAMIVLQSNDFNVAFNGAEMHRDGSFVIRDVSPGTYTILATIEGAPVPMMARQSLQVGSNSVEGVRLAAQTGATIRGRLHLEGKADSARFNPSQILVELHPTDGENEALMTLSIGNGFSPLARVTSDGSFQWTNVPPGNYSVRLGEERTSHGDWFVKSVTAGGRASDDTSLDVQGGMMVLDVTVGTSGGSVDGMVTDSNGEPVTDAVIVAAPESSLRSQTDRFHKTVSDQYGRFSLRGIVPGQYSLFAWESVESDAYYDPDFLKNYEQQARPVSVAEGDHKSVQLQAIPSLKEQQ